MEAGIEKEKISIDFTKRELTGKKASPVKTRRPDFICPTPAYKLGMMPCILNSSVRAEEKDRSQELTDKPCPVNQ